MGTEKVLVSLRNVSKIYGKDEAKIEALKGISLDIQEGQIVTIMGPSGSGKTTLLNILGTMDLPTSGEVIVGDIDLAKIKENKIARYRQSLIGMIFQNFYLLPNLDVMNNVLSPLIPYGIKSKDEKRAFDLLKAVGLEGREKSNVRKLSGGQAQRVAIARALVNDPQIILADEPTGNLDSETGKAIINLLISLSQQGKTVIIVTHDPRIGQMVAAMSNGRNIWMQDGAFSDKPTYDVFCYDVAISPSSNASSSET